MSEAPRPPHQSVLRWLDHQLTPLEQAELVERLRSDPEARRQTAALLLQIGVLGEMAGEPDGARRPRRSDPLQAERRRIFTVVALLAGLAAAVALLVIGVGRPSGQPAGRRPPAFARPVARTPSAIGAVAGSHRAVFVHGENLEQPAGDAVLAGHLQRLGFDVSLVLDAELAASDVRNADLVVISASTRGKVIRARLPLAGLREAPVPIVTCETATFDLLGMTAPREGDGITSRFGFGSAPGHTGVEIVSPGHALAAGLGGPIAVASTAVALSWGQPSREAIRVAHLETNPDLVTQFAYERGAAMAGVRAPARRVGCFISAEAAEQLTPEGWALFDAGVRWASGP
jgi:hypothetical protein